VAQRGGQIQVVRNLSTTPSQSTFIDLVNALPAGETLPPTSNTEYGLLSMAFHPNYASNGYFFVLYSVRRVEGGNNVDFQRVARLKVRRATRMWRTRLRTCHC
jgi:hypothetical protein